MVEHNGYVGDAAVMTRNDRVNEVAAKRPEARQGSSAPASRLYDNVRDKNRRRLPRSGLPRSLPMSGPSRGQSVSAGAIAATVPWPSIARCKRRPLLDLQSQGLPPRAHRVRREGGRVFELILCLALTSRVALSSSAWCATASTGCSTSAASPASAQQRVVIQLVTAYIASRRVPFHGGYVGLDFEATSRVGRSARGDRRVEGLRRAPLAGGNVENEAVCLGEPVSARWSIRR
jgi:hypothetical protein